MPVGYVRGAKPGPKICIFGGQHGTEYAGIEAVLRLYRTLDPKDVTGEVAIALTTHEDSFLNWTQFAPTTPDIKSMMLELAASSQCIINCHGGEFSEGMYPYVICRLIGQDDADRLAMKMGEAFGFPLISISRYRGDPPPDPSGARPAWWLWPKRSLGDELQVPEITPEFGEAGNREDGPMYTGILNVLKMLGYLSGEPELPREKPRVIGDRHWLTASEQGIFFPSVKIGDDVMRGHQLGVVRDYFGNILEEITAPGAGKVMNMNIGMPVQKEGFLLWLGEVEATSSVRT